jgi:hypothetical protein
MPEQRKCYDCGYPYVTNNYCPNCGSSNPLPFNGCFFKIIVNIIGIGIIIGIVIIIYVSISKSVNSDNTATIPENAIIIDSLEGVSNNKNIENDINSTTIIDTNEIKSVNSYQDSNATQKPQTESDYPNNIISEADVKSILNGLGNSFEQIDLNVLDYFSDNVILYHSFQSPTKELIRSDILNYLKRWIVVDDEILEVSRDSDMPNLFYYSKTLLINRRDNNLNDQRKYKIKGFIQFDEEGKIVKLKDAESERIN